MSRALTIAGIMMCAGIAYFILKWLFMTVVSKEQSVEKHRSEAS